jgi:hypothetical protein
MAETDPPSRLPRPFANVGHGATEEEAREAKRRSKIAQVPFGKVAIPQEFSDAEFDKMLLARIECMMHDVMELNTIAASAPGSVPAGYVDSVRTALYEMWVTVDEIWQSLHDRSELGEAGGTLVGWLMRMQRTGLLAPGGEFRFVMSPGKGDGPAIARVHGVVASSATFAAPTGPISTAM